MNKLSYKIRNKIITRAVLPYTSGIMEGYNNCEFLQKATLKNIKKKRN